MNNPKRRKRITGGTTPENRLFNQAIIAQDKDNVPSLINSTDANYFNDREDYLMSLY